MVHPFGLWVLSVTYSKRIAPELSLPSRGAFGLQLIPNFLLLTAFKSVY